MTVLSEVLHFRRVTSVADRCTEAVHSGAQRASCFTHISCIALVARDDVDHGRRSDEAQLRKAMTELIGFLTTRGYSEYLVKQKLTKALAKSRAEVLQRMGKPKTTALHLRARWTPVGHHCRPY